MHAMLGQLEKSKGHHSDGMGKLRSHEKRKLLYFSKQYPVSTVQYMAGFTTGKFWIPCSCSDFRNNLKLARKLTHCVELLSIEIRVRNSCSGYQMFSVSRSRVGLGQPWVELELQKEREWGSSVQGGSLCYSLSLHCLCSLGLSEAYSCPSPKPQLSE